MKNQRRISSLLVHRAQREIGILVLVVLLITTVFLAFAVHLTMEQSLRQIRFGELSGGAAEALVLFKRLLLDRMLVGLGIGIFVIGFVIVKAIHRATGPLGRVIQTLRSLADGGLPRELIIRENDYYVELVEEVNRVIRTFKSARMRKTTDVAK